MKTHKLTQQFIRSLMPKSHAYTVKDTMCLGLGVRVMPDKRMQYVISRLIDNRPRTRILAPVSALSIKAARETAGKQLQAWREEETEEVITASPRFDVFVEQTWKPMIFVQWKQGTKDTSLIALNKRLLPSFGRYPVHMISHKAVQAWFDEVSKQTKGAANRNLDVLKSVFKLALRQGHCTINPASGIKPNKRRVLNRFLSLPEMQRLSNVLDEAEQQDNSVCQCCDILRLLLLTGCRLSEITYLQGDYVRGNELHLPDSKTGAKVVHIGQAAVMILRRYHSRPNTPIFPMTRGSLTTRVKSLWVRLRVKAGIEDVRLHDLRHTFASYAVIDGHSIPMVASLLGHKKVAMTLRYTHVSDDVVEQAAEKLGEIFKGIVSQKKHLPLSDSTLKPTSKAKPKRKPKAKSIKPKKVKQTKRLSEEPLTKAQLRAARALRDIGCFF